MKVKCFAPFCLFAFAILSSGCRAESSDASSARSSASGAPTSSTIALDLAVDPRVELISIVFRLAGNREYNRCRIPSYNAAIDKHFKPVADHALVALARRLRQDHGVSYDAPMGLAVRLPALADWKAGQALKVSTARLDGRWKPDDLRDFLALLPTFVKDSKFEEFLKKNESLYAYTIKQARVMMDGAHLEWFEKFYGRRGAIGFHFVPALVNGPGCYGVSTRARRREEMYCVLGVWDHNLFGMPSFDSSMLGTVAHEFSHSFCNPIVDAHMGELKEAGERMFPPIKDKMAQQAYGQWETVMYESMVRAAEVRYAADTKGADEEKKAIYDNTRRGFTWVGELAGLLKQYEAQRDRYPTLDAFFPEVVKLFEKISHDVASGR